MAIFDIVSLAVILVSTLAGLRSGLIRSVASLAGLFFGITVAGLEYRSVAPKLEPWTHSRPLAELAAFCLLAIGGMVVCGLLGWALKALIHGVGLGFLDRILGGVFGALRGLVLMTVIVMALVAFFPSTGWLAGSWLERRLMNGAEAATHLTTDEMKHRVLDGLTQVRKHISGLVESHP